jgi:pimeloyl-ACP methyl ester carboxylesterase
LGLNTDALSGKSLRRLLGVKRALADKVPVMDKIVYDEFSMFGENASEYGLPFEKPPVVRRVGVSVADGGELSALIWGTEAASYVLLHGGGQNAHTWDTVALALGEPLLAIDLPGHGHSFVPDVSVGISPPILAEFVAEGIAQLTEKPIHLIGMSLGGLTAIVVAATHPELVASLTLVDITPGVKGAKTAAIGAFVNGPATFPSFEELLARTIEHNPTRTEASMRRGILHNALQLDDGSWMWRYRRGGAASPIGGSSPAGQGPNDGIPSFTALWDQVASLAVPVMLVRGMRVQSVIDDDDEAELLRRQPSARIEHFVEAGHSVQGDMPVELAAVIADFTN